jgi:aldehyde:ferredoxin oxidoreductase
VACIGPAGEQMSLIACVMNNHGRAAGRSGLGAVMGSKRLKAVAVQGDLKPPVASSPEVMRDMRKRHATALGGHAAGLRATGTPGSTTSAASSTTPGQELARRGGGGFA